MVEVHKPELPFCWRFSGWKLGSACPAPPVQRGHHGPHHAEPATPGTQHQHWRSPAHTPCRTVTYWSVSSWEHAQDLANGSLQADPWTHWVPGWDLCTRFGLQDLVTKESAAPFSLFFFLMQLLNLSSWYGRINATFDFCLVWLQWHPYIMC